LSAPLFLREPRDSGSTPAYLAMNSGYSMTVATSLMQARQSQAMPVDL
jgi:hypothetical protein